MSWSMLLPVSMFSLKNFPYKSISCCATPVVASPKRRCRWETSDRLTENHKLLQTHVWEAVVSYQKTLEVTVSYMRESPCSAKLTGNAVCWCFNSLCGCIVEIFHRFVSYSCWIENTRFIITSWALRNYGCLFSGTPVHISKQIYHSVVGLLPMITFTTINLA